MSDKIKITVRVGEGEYSDEISFDFTDIQTIKHIEPEDLRGRTIEHIETRLDGTIYLRLEEVNNS